MIAFLIIAIIVEGVVELITSSEISDVLFKDKLKIYVYQHINDKNVLIKFLKFLNKITSCGYCCSVWVSMIAALLPEGSYLYYYPANVFALHRLSNYVHSAFELMRRGRVQFHDVRLNAVHKQSTDPCEIDDENSHER